MGIGGAVEGPAATRRDVCYTRGRCSRLVNMFQVPGGNKVSVPNDLRSLIRQRILAGDLPKENCRMTWYGPGTGGICAACGQPIAASESEVECDLPNGGTIRLHRRCYDLWTA